MRDEKALALFNEIVQKTTAKVLEWKPAAQEGHFVASLAGKYTLKVWPYTSQDDSGENRGGPSITLNDDKNRMLLDITEDIEGIGSQRLRALANTAERVALKVDEKIDDALEALKKLDMPSH